MNGVRRSPPPPNTHTPKPNVRPPRHPKMMRLALLLLQALPFVTPLAPLPLPALSRRGLLGSAAGALSALAASSPAASAAELASPSAELMAVKKQLLSQAARRAEGDPSAASPAELDNLVKRLCAMNPVAEPGLRESYRPFSDGEWRVVYAPHIETLSKLGLTRFAPISYFLSGDKIVSNVK